MWTGRFGIFVEIGSRVSCRCSCTQVWKRSFSRYHQTEHCSSSDYDISSCHCCCFPFDQAESCRETKLGTQSCNMLFLVRMDAMTHFAKEKNVLLQSSLVVKVARMIVSMSVVLRILPESVLADHFWTSENVVRICELGETKRDRWAINVLLIDWDSIV